MLNTIDRDKLITWLKTEINFHSSNERISIDYKMYMEAYYHKVRNISYQDILNNVENGIIK